MIQSSYVRGFCGTGALCGGIADPPEEATAEGSSAALTVRHVFVLSTSLDTRLQ